MFNIDSKDIIYNPEEQSIRRGPLQPLHISSDATATTKIFPSRVLYGYNKPADETTALEWERYMLTRAEETPGPISVYWSSALNSGSTGGRYWFGYLFKGAIDARDFDHAPKESEVTDAHALTAVVKY